MRVEARSSGAFSRYHPNPYTTSSGRKSLYDSFYIEIEVTSKPVAKYQNDEYFELELPVAPAIMVGKEIVVEGSNISQDKVEAVICRCLGMPEPVPEKKGIFDRILGR